MAGRAEVYVHMDRVRGHCVAHGKKLLRDLVVDECLVAERGRVDATAKRVRTAELSFLFVPAPVEVGTDRAHGRDARGGARNP